MSQVSSDVVFFSSFATVSAMMVAPNCSAIGLFNVELNVRTADTATLLFILLLM